MTQPQSPAGYDASRDPFELVAQLQYGSEPQRAFAADALARLSRDDEEARCAIITVPHAAQALVKCLAGGRDRIYTPSSTLHSGFPRRY
jgi:hypothetical protein